MIEQVSNALAFYAFYTESKVGKSGLTVTVDVYRGTTQVVTGASATEVGGGLYRYTLASGSVTIEEGYAAIFKTATTSVDAQHVPSLWTVGVAGVEYLTAAESLIAASGTAQSGFGSTITLAAGASATTDLYKGLAVHIYGGTGAGQTRTITSYNGTSKQAGVDAAWATTPDSTSQYAILRLRLPAIDASLAVVAASVTGNVGGNVVGSVGGVSGNVTGSVASVTGAVGSVTGAVTLATSQPNYAPAKAGDAMALTTGERTSVGTAVWATPARTLTAGTNIVLAKGTGVTGFNDLDAAAVRAGVGLASANLDTQLTTIDDFLDTEVAAILAAAQAIQAKTDNLPASPAAVGSAMTLAADSVNASVLAADAVAEIQSGLATASALSALAAALVTLDSGTVSASPAPSTTGFTATGASLNAASNTYTGMYVLFTSGALAGCKRQVATHAVSGSNHAFTFAAGDAFPAAPASGSAFVLG